MLEKPAHIAENPIMSAKWDEVTALRDFDARHVSDLEQLCFWYAIFRKCQSDVVIDGSVEVAYYDDKGSLKSIPQIGLAKQASEQIRQLNKRLGLSDEANPLEPEKEKETVIVAVRARRENRAARAKNTG